MITIKCRIMTKMGAVADRSLPVKNRYKQFEVIVHNKTK